MEAKEVVETIIMNKVEQIGLSMKKGDIYTKTLEQIGFDSLDIMEIVIEAEGRIGKHVQGSKIYGVRTVVDICNLFS